MDEKEKLSEERVETIGEVASRESPISVNSAFSAYREQVRIDRLQEFEDARLRRSEKREDDFNEKQIKFAIEANGLARQANRTAKHALIVALVATIVAVLALIISG